MEFLATKPFGAQGWVRQEQLLQQGGTPDPKQLGLPHFRAVLSQTLADPTGTALRPAHLFPNQPHAFTANTAELLFKHAELNPKMKAMRPQTTGFIPRTSRPTPRDMQSRRHAGRARVKAVLQMQEK